MTTPESPSSLPERVRRFVFSQTAQTAVVPQAADISRALAVAEAEVRDALRTLAASRIIVLAPNGENIWIAAPFCAVPTNFRISTADQRYWAICIWDALGVAAILRKDATIATTCGDCSEPMSLEVRSGALVRGEGVVHFAVPARRWWDNIGFT